MKPQEAFDRLKLSTHRIDMTVHNYGSEHRADKAGELTRMAQQVVSAAMAYEEAVKTIRPAQKPPYP